MFCGGRGKIRESGVRSHPALPKVIAMKKPFERPPARTLPPRLKSANLTGHSAPAPAPPTPTASKAPPPVMIEVVRLRTDGGTQVRARIDPDVVAEYREALEDGTALPAVTAFDDGDNLWLADGFHRLAACRDAKIVEIPVRVVTGSRRDAQLHAAGANAKHGLRRSNEDKRRAVLMLLADQEWAGWSDRSIAETCHVGNKFVGDVRRQVIREHKTEDRRSTVSEHSSVPETRKGRDGKVRRVPISKAKTSTPPREAGSDDNLGEETPEAAAPTPAPGIQLEPCDRCNGTGWVECRR
jgi:ParB-like chromosome segregation protein Spo0J